jgi:hypothetical protein
MTDLSDLTGVGPATAEELESEGYTVADVADADADEIEQYLTPSVDPSETIADAEDATEDTTADTSTATEAVEAATDESGTDSEADSETDMDEIGADEILVEFSEPVDDDLMYAIMRAVLDKELDARRTNNFDRHETTMELVDKLARQYEADDPTYAYTFEELNVLYTALNDEQRNLAGTTGISTFSGRVKNARDDVQQVRRDNWPDNE